MLADGTVVVSAAGYPCGKGTSKCTGVIKYGVFRSTNDGASYAQTVVDSLYTGPQYLTDGLETIASDAAGTLVLMYSGAPSLGADNGVFVRQSVNGGATWSAAIPLLESGITADACYPAIVGAAAGSFRATFFDTRTREFNIWYRESSDGEKHDLDDRGENLRQDLGRAVQERQRFRGTIWRLQWHLGVVDRAPIAVFGESAAGQAHRAASG